MATAKAGRKSAGKSVGGSARKPKKAARKRAGKSVAKTAKKARKAARRSAPKAKRGRPAKLLTLTEVSKRTGISMPTLQRYKKEYQDRIPAEGEGRKQRYHVASLAVFKSIKKENLKKRGRPRKSPAEKAAKQKKASRRATPAGLISLSEVGRRTGISYPTLLRYVRLHGDRIPSEGSGRKRRYPESAVPVFQQLRKESRRGRRKGTVAKKRSAAGAEALSARIGRLERQQAKLAKQVQALVRALKRPVKLNVRGV